MEEMKDLGLEEGVTAGRVEVRLRQCTVKLINFLAKMVA